MQEKEVIRPDLSGRPFKAAYERTMAAPSDVLFKAWTTDDFSKWFAWPGTVLMTPEVNIPYFFETRFDGQRHPHYGRFLDLQSPRLIEMVWITAMGTKGVETIVTVELTPDGSGSHLRLSHVGFLDEAAATGHEEAWPQAIELLDAAFRETP